MGYQKFVLAKVGGMVNDIAVFTEFKENWQYFFTETTMTPDSPGSVDKVLTIKQHLVRRGPGDPNPYIRKAHQRFFARYPKSKGSARPGYTIHVAEPAVLGPGYREFRQFSVQGDLMDLWAYAQAKAKMRIKLIGPNGWSEFIDGATAQSLAPTGRALLANPTAAPVVVTP
jgi:hypothetical protein